MEKYARQALSEGIKNAEDLHVSVESELYRVLNLHYNRNNHIEVRDLITGTTVELSSSSLHSVLLLSNNNLRCLYKFSLSNQSWNPSTVFIFSRFLTGSDGLLNKLLRSSLSQSRLEKTWILHGKNKFTRSLHAWTTTFQNILNLKHFWSN